MDGRQTVVHLMCLSQTVCKIKYLLPKDNAFNTFKVFFLFSPRQSALLVSYLINPCLRAYILRSPRFHSKAKVLDSASADLYSIHNFYGIIYYLSCFFMSDGGKEQETDWYESKAVNLLVNLHCHPLPCGL